MSNNEPEPNVSSREAAQEPALTLDDLLNAESEALKRVAREYSVERSMAGHYMTRTGHTMSGTHSMHSMAKVERPLDN